MPSDRDAYAIRRAIFATHHHALAAEATLQASLAVGHMVTHVDEDGTMVPAFTLRSGPAPQVHEHCTISGLQTTSASRCVLAGMPYSPVDPALLTTM